jgi:L-ascorbate metabolism protein UlaG (beta-lactamase superfamily)
MQIIWHGQSCFEIITAKGKGEYITVLIDPLSEAKTGIKAPETDAQIVLLTNSDYTAGKGDLDKIASGAFVVDSPGEYEVKGIYIRGIDVNFGRADAAKGGAAGTMYTIEAEEMKLCHLGNFADAELAQAQVEKIGNVDILMAPIGDGVKFGAKEALKIVSQVEPSIAIPMNYEIPKLKIVAGDLKEFLKAAGASQIEPLAKLTIKKKEIPVEEAKIIVLNP